MVIITVIIKVIITVIIKVIITVNIKVIITVIMVIIMVLCIGISIQGTKMSERQTNAGKQSRCC